jgi:hypothetical protein
MRKHTRLWITFMCTMSVTLSLSLSSCSLDGTTNVPGDVNAFDPVANYAPVASYAGAGAKLVKLTTRFVRENGTQDLEADYIGFLAPTEYEFVRPNQQQQNSNAPVGARPAVPPTEGVKVSVQKPHWVHVESNTQSGSFKHRGMEFQSYGSGDPKLVVPPPSCSFAKLWTIAKQHDAPAGAVAAITYDLEGYSFKIEGTPVDLKFDANCELKK